MKKRFKRKDLLVFRALLLERRRQIAGTYEHFKSDALSGVSRRDGDLSSLPSEGAEIGTALYDQAIALNLLANEASAIGEIDQAIKRIDLGTFGTCENCGRPIPKARLKVLPFATLCVKCREEEERHYHGYAG